MPEIFKIGSGEESRLLCPPELWYFLGTAFLSEFESFQVALNSIV